MAPSKVEKWERGRRSESVGTEPKRDGKKGIKNVGIEYKYDGM